MIWTALHNKKGQTDGRSASARKHGAPGGGQAPFFMRSRSGLFLVILVAAISGMESTASAQRRPFVIPGNGVTAEMDRGVMQAMLDAQQAIRQQQYARAVMSLQNILDHPEDYFLRRDFHDKNVQYPGIRGQTHRIIAELPAEGKAAYELQFGATARARLNEALAADNFEKLAEVVRRYQMTAAGFDALQKLAASCFDHDRLFEAAMIYESMIDHPSTNKELNASLLVRAAYVWQLAGQTERSVTLLESLRSTGGLEFWQIGQQKVPPYQNRADAADWLSTHFGPPVKQPISIVNDWPTPRGGQTGNESASTAFPVGGTAWTNSSLKYTRFSIDDEVNQNLVTSFDQLAQQVERSLRDANRLTQPAAVPLVVGDTVVYRTLNDVTAVDLRTGQLQWRSSQTDGMLAWMFQVPIVDADKSFATSPASIPGYLRHKLFRDQLAGSISSDGQNVYAIEGSESQFSPLRPRVRQRFGGPFAIPPSNKLVAYDLNSGQIAWEVGGQSGTPPVELSGLFFLGPPLPHAGRLYCLAEVKDELCLIVISSEGSTAKLDYSQALISLNPVDWVGWPRRHAGLIPVVSDQIMICPTSNGSVLAFDLLFRQLRWGYSYDILRNRNDDDERQLGLPFHGISFQTEEEEGRWLDGGPVISGGHLIVTPRDSGEIHCLNLTTGIPIWKRPRGSGLFVACIDDNKVYVVGRSQIVAFSLEDGSDVWNTPIEIVEPAGRGVRVGSKYLLPLMSGEIATVDLPGARIMGRSRLPDDQLPGNLAIGDGALVSCGIHKVTAFPSLHQIEQKIRESIAGPDNADALALRGELRLHQGEESAAINDLRQSLTLRPDSRVKRILAGTLLNIVKKDPAQLLKLADEMLELTEEPRQKIEFLRLYAESLHVTGDPVGAVKQLFRLAEMTSATDEMIVSGPGYSLSIDRGIQSQLLTIYETANADQRTRIEQEFQQALNARLEAADNDQSATSFLKLVAGHPAAEPMLLSFVDSRKRAANELEEFRLLERLSFSKQPSIAGPAVARLAERALARDSAREAQPWIEQLNRQFATEICRDGLSGQQLYEKWSAREDVRAAIAPALVWPDGPTDVQRSTGPTLPIYHPVEIVTQRGSHFAGWSFEIDPLNGMLQARDSSLKVAWQLPYPSFQEVTRALPCQLHLRGHRMAFSFGTWLVVMESTDSYAPPTVLFEKLTRSSAPVEWRSNEFRIERRLLPSGRRAPFDGRNPTGFLVGLSDNAVYYQLENRLQAFDLESGRLAWSRMGPQFAKSDAVVDRTLTLHTDSNDAILLRPADGKLLSHLKGNRAEKILWFNGTRRLAQRLDGNEQLTVEMRELDGDQSVWKSQHPTGSSSWVVENEDLAVVEPSGKLTIIELQTGKTRLTAQIPVVRPFGSGGVLAVQHYGSRYIVVTGVSTRRTELISVVTLNSDTSFTVDGHVTAVDSETGKVAWTVPVEQLAFDYSQPAKLPILVLASQHLKTDRLGRREMIRLSALLLDKQTGRTVYATQESLLQTCPGARFIPQVEDHKLVVDFATWNLAFTFDKPDK